MAAVVGGLLLLSSAVGAGAYFMTNKSGEEPTGQVGPVQPPPPPPPPPPPGFEDMDQVKGHPIKKGGDHVASGGNWSVVGAGDAPTAEDCYNFSKDNDLSHWGWRRSDKSCWVYMDTNLLTLMKDTSGIQRGSQANHTIGCTKPGTTVAEGCIDRGAGNIVWGHKNGPAGFYGIGGQTKMSMEQCREMSKEQGFESFSYRTNFHPNDAWTTTCFVNNDHRDLKGWVGNGGDKAHLTGCVDPSKKVRDGCQ